MALYSQQRHGRRFQSKKRCGMTIYGYFRRWRQQGVWAGIMDTLRMWERRGQGRKDDPSAACADKQSFKKRYKKCYSPI